MDKSVNTEYLQDDGGGSSCGEQGEKVDARHAQRCASHGTNRNSSSSTPFTVFSTRFTFLQR